MTLDENIKLYLVKLGEPNLSLFGSHNGALFVLAKSYDEAAKKALIHAEFEELTTRGIKSILNTDGDLKDTAKEPEKEIRVKSIELACEKIIY